MERHAFVIPAYGDSPFLGDCLESLAAQATRSSIVISTSTPSTAIERMASRHGALLRVHGPNRGIGHDWNEALRAAPDGWVTLAHQDDLYHPDYTTRILAAAAREDDAMLAISYAVERIGEEETWATALMIVKRLLTEAAFVGRSAIRSRAAKRRLVAFGSPVICPSVAFNKDRLPRGFAFRADLRCNVDWAAWLELAETPGSIVLCRQALVAQRRHPGAETTKGIASGWRQTEDLAMFRQIWPSPIAGWLARLYRLSYVSRRRAG